jgi:transposase-like protein
MSGNPQVAKEWIMKQYVKEEMLLAYRSAKDCVRRLELLLAEVGCPHRNTTNLTTLGAEVKTYYCRDCGETIEEEENE